MCRVINKILFYKNFQLCLIDYHSTDTCETQVYVIGHSDLLLHFLLSYLLTHSLTYLHITYLRTNSLTYVLTHLLTYLLTYLVTH